MLAVLPIDDQAGADGDEIADAHAQTHHPQSAHLRRHAGRHRRLFLAVEGEIGTQHHDDVDDRPGQQVGGAATDRQPLAQQSAHDGDDAALAHRKEQTQQAADGDGQEPAARQNARDEFLRQQFFEQPGDDRPEDDERHRLQENAHEDEDEVGDVDREGMPQRAETDEQVVCSRKRRGP